VKQKKPPRFFLIIALFLTCIEFLPARETEIPYKPRQQYLPVDIPLTIGEVMMVNIIGNLYWRKFGVDKEAAYFTADSIWANLNPAAWDFEKGQGGDTFVVNQFSHPYAGAIYFASARSNNFNFYWATLSSFFGSLTWEALGEVLSPSSSDLINTALGGIALGEVLHRLYLELDKGGIGGKIGATVLSPTDRITAAIRGYGPESGPSKIYDAGFAAGFSWSNAHFLEEKDLIITWNKPSVFFDAGLVYGDPFVQYSKTPFDHFELRLMTAFSIPLMYNFNLSIDGYLASWLLRDDETNRASQGISLHFDDYIVDRNILELANGTENLSLNSNSLNYTLKWRRQITEGLSFSSKFHIGFSPWVIADYNGGINRDDYNCYLMGGNIKLALELRRLMGDPRAEEKKEQVLTFNLRFNDAWTIPNTPGFLMNVIFSNAELKWAFPLTHKFSLYVADSFAFMHVNLLHEKSPDFPNITRWYNCVQVGVKILL
jgi:hypothetical protein